MTEYGQIPDAQWKLENEVRALSKDLNVFLNYFRNIDMSLIHDPECNWKKFKCYCGAKRIKEILVRRGIWKG